MQFRLQVQGGPGGRQTIAIDATSEADAVRQAARNGWRVLAIDSTIGTGNTGAGERVRSGIRKQPFPLLQFSQELLAPVSYTHLTLPTKA